MKLSEFTSVTVTGFYYGVVAIECNNIIVEYVNASKNWIDQDAFLDVPPWLDINVLPGLLHVYSYVRRLAYFPQGFFFVTP